MSTLRVNNVFDASGGTTSLQVGGAPPARIVQGTAQASTSGTAIDFTGIPSWVKRVTVMLNGVSTNGTSVVRIQLGAGSVQTTGYVTGYNGGGSTAGFDLGNFSTASDLRYGHIQFAFLASNAWTGMGGFTQGQSSFSISGGVTLSGTLDRVRITTVNGTDTFDAGSINILYEG